MHGEFFGNMAGGLFSPVGGSVDFFSKTLQVELTGSLSRVSSRDVRQAICKLSHCRGNRQPKVASARKRRRMRVVVEMKYVVPSRVP